MRNLRMFQKINIAFAFTSILLLLSNDSNAKGLRMPLNLFELIPLEAHWLIDGEGLVDFKHVGQYKFTTQFEGMPPRTVNVHCNLNSIEICLSQNNCTSCISIIKDTVNDITINHVSNSQIIERVRWIVKPELSVLLYLGDTIYVNANGKWEYSYYDNSQAIFGEGSIKNSIYIGDIMDRQRFPMVFSRQILQEVDHKISIIERRFFGFHLKSTSDYEMHKSKKKLRLKSGRIGLIISAPPKKVSFIEYNLKVDAVRNRLLIREMCSPEATY
jgi:hypothetical protein